MKILFILSILLLNTLSQAKTLKIGYINVDHLVTSSAQFIQANQIVVKEFQPQQDELITLANKINSLVKEFKQDKDTLSQLEIKSEIKKITNLEQQLKRQASSLKKQLALRNTQELSKIQDLINQTIKAIAIEKKFDLILYQEVAYVSKELNITPLIAEQLRLQFE
ncbi:MAG: OmpH family outer membrane protein [Candidatus Thioglobus sp.]|nr:OmpH family outer membrane protein [Candidatus Thioglobus sp.]